VPSASKIKTSIRIAEVITIKLIVVDTVQPHGRVGRYYEVESRTGWASFSEGRWQPTSCDPLFADESHTYEAARGMRFKLEERSNLLGSHLVYHLFPLNIEHQTRNV
jgi:hypothetical protein